MSSLLLIFVVQLFRSSKLRQAEKTCTTIKPRSLPRNLACPLLPGVRCGYDRFANPPHGVLLMLQRAARFGLLAGLFALALPPAGGAGVVGCGAGRAGCDA